MIEKLKEYGLVTVAASLFVFALVFFISARGFSDQGAYVEVKGLSERIVKADVAVWSMNFEVESNSIDGLALDIERNMSATKAFLVAKGFEASEINVAPVNIYQIYKDTYRESLFTFNASIQLSVYTKKVDLIRIASSETLELVKKGITMSNNSIMFEFSDINSIKPEMLSEAIKNARVSADQFAENSNSSLGPISRANQGVFDISEKDPGSPEYKKIRVVSSVRFLLK